MQSLRALVGGNRGYDPLPLTPTYPLRKRQPWYRTWRFTLLGALFFFSALLFTTTQSTALLRLPTPIQPAPEASVELPRPDDTPSAPTTPAINPLLVDQLFPVDAPNPENPYLYENRRSLHELIGCLAKGTCAENQTSVVILGSPHFDGALRGLVQGEDIWAASVIDALRSLGYTLFFVRCCTSHDTALDAVLPIYRQFPGLVKAILVDSNSPIVCAAREDCVQSPTNPTGLPLEKLLAFYFWESPQHPLGGAWTLSPEDWPAIRPAGNGRNNTYLGYSIERNCGAFPAVPHADREHRAYALGKYLRFFVSDSYAWPGADFGALGVPAVAGIGNFNEAYDFADLPRGIENLGPLPKARFYEELGKSKVLLGIGESKLSPSPYDALCMGVPFINPVLGWDAADPDDRSRWFTQHDGLSLIEEPYVYHVRKGDIEGLGRALRTAVDTPIESFVPPAMTASALRARVAAIMERDFAGAAAARRAEIGWDGALPLRGKCADEVRKEGHWRAGMSC